MNLLHLIGPINYFPLVRLEISVHVVASPFLHCLDDAQVMLEADGIKFIHRRHGCDIGLTNVGTTVAPVRKRKPFTRSHHMAHLELVLETCRSTSKNLIRQCYFASLLTTCPRESWTWPEIFDRATCLKARTSSLFQVETKDWVKDALFCFKWHSHLWKAGPNDITCSYIT